MVLDHAVARTEARPPNGDGDWGTVFARARLDQPGHRPSNVVMSARRVALFFVGALLWAAPSFAALIGQQVMERAQVDGEAMVIVALRPTDARGTGGAPARRAAIAARRRSVLRATRREDVRLVRAYESVGGFLASVTPAGLGQLGAHPEVAAVDLDEVGGVALSSSASQIRADVIHERGITGDGVVIAILDTGVDASHPDIGDALIDEECFCSYQGACCPNRSTRQSGTGAAQTRNDHGMNVAGIALSRGRIAPLGIAPGAQLVSVKVLSDSGRGRLSDWVAALDWILSKRKDVKVVNMSLQSGTVYRTACDSDGATNMLFSALIDALYARGTLLFAAAGNNASDESIHAITAPACIHHAVAVGAVNDDDEVADFSDSAALVDLLAPGVNILSDGVQGRTSRLSGTSMAVPHAAGVAALLYSANPSAGAPLVEGALKLGGVPVVDERNGLTFPRIDAVNAFDAVASSAGSLLGGGAAETDCLLQWRFVPPSIVWNGPLPAAVCTDNDPSCDADTIEGQCTFQLSLCFNTRDARVSDCEVDEPLVGYDLTWPRPDGPGSASANARALARALPSFPLDGSTCTAPFAYVVSRPPGTARRGIDAIRLAVRTPTRRDYDRVSLICSPP